LAYLASCPKCNQEWESRKGNPKRCPRCNARLATKQQLVEAREGQERHEVKGDSWEISLPRTRICSLQELIAHCKVDTEIWEVDRWVCNKWEVGTASEGKVVVEPLFQVKAWLKKKVNVENARNYIREMIEEAKQHAPKYPPLKRVKADSGNLLEVNLTDHHFGKLAWSPETGGWGDYDLKIANDCWDTATDALLSRVSALKFEQAVLVIGNDLMHVDNQALTTTRGTQLTTDTRFQKIYPSVRRAIIRTIDKMLPMAPLKVIVMPGNHDTNSSFCMGDSLECWYSKASDISIDNSPAPRKYLKWGDVLLMWTHGNEGKLSDYPQIMAVEQPEAWGKTRIRECHTGDKHQRRLEEFHGVAVRIMPTLCAPDEWHSKKGFVGNLRTSEAYIWNKQEGLIGTAVYTMPDKLPERVA